MFDYSFIFLAGAALQVLLIVLILSLFTVLVKRINYMSSIDDILVSFNIRRQVFYNSILKYGSITDKNNNVDYGEHLFPKTLLAYRSNDPDQISKFTFIWSAFVFSFTIVFMLGSVLALNVAFNDDFTHFGYWCSVIAGVILSIVLAANCIKQYPADWDETVSENYFDKNSEFLYYAWVIDVAKLFKNNPELKHSTELVVNAIESHANCTPSSNQGYGLHILMCYLKGGSKAIAQSINNPNSVFKGKHSFLMSQLHCSGTPCAYEIVREWLNDGLSHKNLLPYQSIHTSDKSLPTTKFSEAILEALNIAIELKQLRF